MSCPQCRVPSDEEHLASGWHKFNMRLTAEGKMPIMLDNYLRFEKPKEDAAAAGLATPVGAAEGVATYLELNKRNVNQWHWEETDHTEWAKARMSELFDGLEVALGDGAPKITFTGVTEFAGDAFTHIRKAKFSAGYELSFGLDWKAELDDFSATGSCYLAEVSFGSDDHDVTRIKLEGAEGPARTAALQGFRSKGVKAILAALKTFDKEMRDKALPPKDSA